MLEDDAICLHCELSKKGKSVMWLINGSELVEDCRIDIVFHRYSHELFIENAMLDDVGKYSCVCEHLSTSAAVTVIGELCYLLYISILIFYLCYYYFFEYWSLL